MNQSFYKLLLSILFISHNNSFASQHLGALLETTGKGVAWGIGGCAALVMLESYLQSRSEKVSDVFKDWANKQLMSSIGSDREIKCLDYRLGSCWRNGTVYVGVDKNDAKKINDKMLYNYSLSEDERLDQANIKYRLFREYKHICDGDRLKLLFCSSAIEMVVRSTKSPAHYLLGKLTTALFFVFYARYQEMEADRYAFKRMNLDKTKTDDVEKVMAYMADEAKKCEGSFKNKISGTISTFFFNALYFIYLKIFRNASATEKQIVRHKIAYFCFNSFLCPDWYTRAELAQEVLNEKKLVEELILPHVTL